MAKKKKAKVAKKVGKKVTARRGAAPVSTAKKSLGKKTKKPAAPRKAVQTKRVAGTINMDEAKEMAERAGFGSGDFFKIGKDNAVHVMRMLGPIHPLTFFCLEHRPHYLRIGNTGQGFDVPGDDRRRAIHCLDFHKGMACPICIVDQWLHDNPEAVKKNISMSARPAFLANIIFDGKYMIWDTCQDVVSGISRIITVNKKVGKSLFDPRVGRDLLVTRRKKKSGFYEYDIQVDVDRSEIEEPDKWMDKARDLRTFVRVFDEQTVLQALWLSLTPFKVPLEEILPDVDWDEIEGSIESE